MPDEPAGPTPVHPSKNRIIPWMAAGAALGATAGAVFGELSLGLGLGLAAGLIIGALLVQKSKRNNP